MISSLHGTISEISGSIVTLDVNGVGYEVICSVSCLDRLERGKDAGVVVFTEVREDSIKLYGFGDKLEKQVFRLLTRVKGIGPKSASEIISAIDKRDLLKFIAAGDLERLQAVKRVGRKTAERIIVELRDKVGEFALETQVERLGVETLKGGVFDDAMAALEALGFSRNEAEQAVKKAQFGAPGLLEAGEIVKEALRFV